MRTLVALIITSCLIIPGCISAESFDGQYDAIYPVYGISGWEMTHHFEKDANKNGI